MDQTTKINQMGNEGKNLLSFKEHLMLEMDQSGWSTMTVVEATVLYWLKGHDVSKKNHVDLGGKVHKAWNAAEVQGIAFTVHDCLKLAKQAHIV